MRQTNTPIAWVLVGVMLGGLGIAWWFNNPQQAKAATSDRHEDYVMCTGAVSINPRQKTDGVWLLDYRTGKLLGTVIDRQRGKVIGWAEVDLVQEFNVPPRGNVHFMMVTGQINDNQAALYIAETSSGKFGVYTMGARPDGAAGIMINRHDLVLFRAKKKN